MPLLTPELQQAVEQQPDQPLELVHPSTSQVYVLIAREKYERLRALLVDEPLTLDEQQRLLADAGRRAGWDDPAMDAYDRYDEHRRPKS